MVALVATMGAASAACETYGGFELTQGTFKCFENIDQNAEAGTFRLMYREASGIVCSGDGDDAECVPLCDLYYSWNGGKYRLYDSVPIGQTIPYQLFIDEEIRIEFDRGFEEYYFETDWVNKDDCYGSEYCNRRTCTLVAD